MSQTGSSTNSLGAEHMPFDSMVEGTGVIALDFDRDVESLGDVEARILGTVMHHAAIALQNRYDESGDVRDLEIVIMFYRDILDKFLPPGHPNRPDSLNNLAVALGIRYTKFGDTNDLDDCILFYADALNFYPPDHPDRPRSLNNLAETLNSRYSMFGNAKDLEDSISFHREALNLCPPGHPNHPSSLNKLAHALKTRYVEFGIAKDLEDCILYHTEALKLHPTDHRDRPTSLKNLAVAFNIRYNKSGNPEDLENCISFLTDALKLSPPGHPNHPSSLNNLADALKTRYEKFGDAKDLEDCILYKTDALNLHPPGDPDRSRWLNNLAYALKTRYDKYGNAKDLDDSILFQTEAVELLPPGHPDLSLSSTVLGIMLMARLHKDDFSRAFFCFEQAACDSTSYIRARLFGANCWVQGAQSYHHESIFRAYKTMLELINHSLIFRPDVEAQQRFLASTDSIPRSLASDAASVAIEAGNIELAVEFLEQGRALLWSKVDAYKHPLHEIRQVEGGDKLADRLQAVSTELERISLQSSSAVSNQEGPTNVVISTRRMKDYRALSEEWEDIVGQVRKIEGFSHFLRAAPFRDLQTAAAEGPVILVNISENRSDAIVLVKDRPPELVELPKVELSTLRTQKLGTTNEIKRTLSYLWKNIVSPIVDRLEGVEIPKQSRIWWCPTAELCALPLHAAYQPAFKDKPKRDLHDEYISSYTPTLSSLIKARSTIIQSPIIPKLLVVGHPSEIQKLEMVDAEVKIVQELGRAKSVDVTVLDGDKANCQAVLNTLKNHSWAHFACHGHLGEESQPFRASFELHDGRLPLLDIIQAKVTNAEFAFLSACHSAAGDLSTPDENIHLSAALQFCGFRSVVGTLWKMDDEDGPTICKKFYKHMFRNPDKMDFRDSAHALNWAIKEMKKGKNKVPLDRLVLFVHIGA